MDLVNNVFELRRKFMIIGLTGRTGSGCTTIANLLKEGFNKIFPPIPKVDHDGIDNDARKYKIEYTFLKKVWDTSKYSFQVIKASDIIFYYVLKEGFDSFIDSIGCDPNKNQNIDDSKKEQLRKILGEEIKSDFEANCKIVNDIDAYLDSEKYRNISLKDSGAYNEANNYWKFINEDIPAFREKVMKLILENLPELHTSQFQYWGNNIRKYGSIKQEEESSDPSGLARTINKIIKMRRKMLDTYKLPAFFIIDTLRNPYEVLYFRERYSAFYLMSITTSNNNRQRNLVAANYRKSEIEKIDEIEYPNKRKDINESYNTQDVQKCIELSDIHIAHNNEPIEHNSNLKRQLIHIISLILHPGLVQPTHEERIMQIANTAKYNSGCISRQVGAVVTDKNYSVKAIGWNTVAKGQTPCSLRSLEDLYNLNDLSAFSEYEKNDDRFRTFVKDTYKKYSCVKGNLNGVPLAFCFKDFYIGLIQEKNQVYTRSLHAEENAFLQLAKYGSEGIEGGYLFTTASPCELCAKKAYQLGITKIFYIDIYPGISFQHIINVGDRKIELIQFSGIIGRAYDALYNPFFALKDEIEYTTKVNVKKNNSEKRISKSDDAVKIKNKN